MAETENNLPRSLREEIAQLHEDRIHDEAVAFIDVLSASLTDDRFVPVIVPSGELTACIVLLPSEMVDFVVSIIKQKENRV